MSGITISKRERRKALIKEFARFLEEVQDHDDANSISQLIGLLNAFLRVKDVTPPMAEIMSILKWQKPKLYHSTRLSLTATSHLVMLFQIDMNVDLAMERLQQFANSEG